LTTAFNFRTLLVKKIKVMKNLLLFTLFNSLLCFGQSQSYPSWIVNNIFPDANSSTSTTVTIDSQGYVLVAGTVYDIDLPNDDIFVAKYDDQGTQIWLQTYGAQDTISNTPNTICADNEGNAYVTFMRHNAASSFWSITVQKYNAIDGTILWTSELTDSQFNGFEWQVKPKYMTIDDNYLYVGGTKFEAGITGSKILTMKLDFNGNIIWSETHSGSGIYANAKSITVDQFGNVYAAGDAWNASIDYCVIKYDSNGNLIWDAFLDGDVYHNTDIAECVLVDNEGNVYITGYNQISSNLKDIVTAKYNQDGVLQWKQNYGNPDYRDNTAYFLEISPDGNLLVGGYSAYEDPYPGTGKDFILLKYTPSGNLVWDTRYDYNNYYNDHPFDFDMDAFGNVYIVGITMKSCYIYKFITTVKVNQQGNIEWDIRVPNLYGTPWEISVVDEDEFVVAAGSFDTIQVETATAIYYQEGESPLYEADIIDVYFDSQISNPIIDYDNRKVFATVHDTANIEFLIPFITRSEHACMYPDDEIVTSFIEPVWYNLTSFDDETEKWWIVYVEGGHVGSKEIEKEKISVFPNPVSSSLQLKSPVFSFATTTIQIFDIKGQLVFEKQSQKGTEIIEFDVSRLDSGLYLCKVSTKEYSATKKIIIQK